MGKKTDLDLAWEQWLREHYQKLAKRRWSKTTKKQRLEHSRMMNEAKRKKRADSS